MQFKQALNQFCMYSLVFLTFALHYSQYVDKELQNMFLALFFL